MSLLLLIDGYNVVAPIGPGRDANPRWLEKHRASLLRDLTKHLEDAVRQRTCVVFDASNPPRDRPATYQHQGIQVQFAVGYPTADDLLEEIIQAHSVPKQLMVVSSDHRVQTAAQRRNASHFDSQPWMDDLTDGLVRLAVRTSKDESEREGEGEGTLKKPDVSDSREVSEWMREFGFED